MAIGNALDGIMKFARIHRWKPCLAEVLTDHVADPIADYGIDYDQLPEIIPEKAFTYLWCCAFEDFLTLTFEPDGANPIEDYLKRNGWKEKAANRTFLRGLQASVMSLYRVGEVVPGESLLAHDLIRPTEPILVTDRIWTHHLQSGDRIAARIVDIGDSDVLGKGLLPFTLDAANALLEDLADDVEGPLTDDDLADLAPLISNAWLFSALSDILGPLPDDDTNSDGEPLLLHEISYELAEGVQPDAVVALLDGSTMLERVEPGHWRWVKSAELDDPDSGKPSHPELQEDGSVILAGLMMDDGVLALTANSAERAERAMARLGELLPGMLAEPVVETTSLEDMGDEDNGKDLDEDPPVLTEEFVYNMLEFQLRSALDEPAVMLDGVTPRVAAQTADSRNKLVAWLEHLERETARQTISGVPMASYDFVWIWRELGIEDQRGSSASVALR